MLLVLHVIIASLTLVSNAYLLAKKDSRRAFIGSMVGLCATAATGALLVITANASLVRMCTSGLLLATVSLGSMYAAKRAAQNNSLN